MFFLDKKNSTFIQIRFAFDSKQRFFFLCFRIVNKIVVELAYLSFVYTYGLERQWNICVQLVNVSVCSRASDHPHLLAHSINEWKSWIFNKCWKIYSIRKWLHWAFFRKRKKKHTTAAAAARRAILKTKEVSPRVLFYALFRFPFSGAHSYWIKMFTWWISVCPDVFDILWQRPAYSVACWWSISLEFKWWRIKKKKNGQTATNASQICSIRWSFG